MLIPAHDEELLVGRAIDSLHQAHYARDARQVFVVADNCSDGTASVARAHGATVYERHDPALKGKGFALDWLVGQVLEEHPAHDAFVILDADCIVAPNFLEALDARLSAGSQVVQVYYTVLNVQESPLAALRAAALAAVHYLRPRGKSALALSCGLKGTGMCFAAPILRRFGWTWFGLAEDVEFHLNLVKAGVRVDFAPETWVAADMPTTLRQANSQNTRWERGRLELLKSHVPGLLWEGLRRRRAMQVDAALEQLVPPLSVPIAGGAAILVCGMALDLRVPSVLAALVLGGLAWHVVAALLLVRAPAHAYVALAYAPIYVAWKVGLYARSLFPDPTTKWVRTPRSPSSPRS
jgi:glycosyltransferase involved in cell wall biosynthesis